VADGVLFVADSTPERLGANAVSLRELESLLAESGRRDLPLVLVYNKRDLPGALPVERLETELNPAGRESFEAVATRGEGLAEALVAVSRRVVEALV
jgi:signal recognition particle receptor subunit beta